MAVPTLDDLPKLFLVFFLLCTPTVITDRCAFIRQLGMARWWSMIMKLRVPPTQGMGVPCSWVVHRTPPAMVHAPEEILGPNAGKATDKATPRFAYFPFGGGPPVHRKCLCGEGSP